MKQETGLLIFTLIASIILFNVILFNLSCFKDPMNGEQGDLIKLLQNNLIDSFPDLQTIEHPHTSLSKTFILKFHWIDNFIR